MQKKLKILILLLVAFIYTITVQDIYAADTTNIISLTAGEMGIVILIGIAGGLLHAYQGYRTGTENFDTIKFVDGVINCTLASIPLAIGQAYTQLITNQPFTLFTFILIFFASIGLGFQIQQTKKPSIPSNADIPPTKPA